MVTVTSTGVQVPQFGGVGHRFSPGINAGGGTGATLTVIGTGDSYSFDEDLNGILSANTLPVFVGQWYVTPVVYYDDDAATGTICAFAGDSVQVNFLAATDPNCDAVGIAENEIEGSLVLFPNPTSGQITISSTEFNRVDAVKILSIDGKLVQDYGTVVLGDGRFVMDLEHLDDGVYFLQVESAGQQGMKRFVLAR
jgi:hypothetical protein